MSFLAKLKGKGPSGFGYGSTAAEVMAGVDLRGKYAVITGATSGLGLESLEQLHAAGACVVALGRTVDKAAQACSHVASRATGAPTPIALECELSDPMSVRGCVDALKSRVPRVDIVMCNAGIMAPPDLRRSRGFELQFLTNHVGHFLLVTGLLGQLSQTARVVVLSSDAHRAAPSVGIDFDNLDGERGYKAMRAYGQSKLANLLFTNELARRFEGTSMTANAVHPGVIRTNLTRSMAPAVGRVLGVLEPFTLKSIAQGAATQCFVATAASLEGVNGQYFADCNISTPSALAQDRALAKRLWRETERMVALPQMTGTGTGLGPAHA